MENPGAAASPAKTSASCTVRTSASLVVNDAIAAITVSILAAVVKSGGKPSSGGGSPVSSSARMRVTSGTWSPSEELAERCLVALRLSHCGYCRDQLLQEQWRR